jgi:glycosyltransferase involved in cell wall biosynthesis
MQEHGYTFTVQSFLDSANWRAFFGKGKTGIKAKALAFGFFKRVKALFKSPVYDFVFIHREATPVGPPIFEWIMARILRKKIIYDFDDAIWLTDRPNESWLLRTGKWRSKVSSICKWSYKVSCGNEYLCRYAALYNKNVVYNPTTVDTENLHNPTLYARAKKENGKVTIGWTGSHSTLKYLTEVESALKRILADYEQVEFVVIADRHPKLSDKVPVTFIEWNNESEIKDLIQFDVGIMPLPDDTWAQGKCGFKALQYMALGRPAVASPVGVNTRIITHGVDGFLCSTPQDWEEVLRKLIESSNLRETIGLQGRKTVIENYSVLSNTSNFLALFE